MHASYRLQTHFKGVFPILVSLPLFNTLYSLDFNDILLGFFMVKSRGHNNN